MPGETTIAVAGGKGGVGKTTTCINVASAAQMLGRETLVVETDLAMANVVDVLDVDVDPTADPTMHDVLAGEAEPEEAIYAAPGGFDVLPSGVSIDGYAATDAADLEAVVNGLEPDYDLVLLDSGAGVCYETVLPVAIADETILVTTPRAASVRNTTNTAELVDRVGGSVSGVVVAQSGTGSAPSAGRIAEFLDTALLGDVPQGEAIAASQDAGEPVLVYDFSSRAAKAYWEIAERVVGARPQEGSGRPRRRRRVPS